MKPSTQQAEETITRLFGAGAIVRADATGVLDPTAIPTRLPDLDRALGIGGLVRGRVVEIYGPPAAGKSSLGMHLIGCAQAIGDTAAYIDAEHSLDASWAAVHSIKMESLLVSQPDNGEQALEIADILVRSGSVGLIVIDSVPALVPRAEIEGEMGDTHTGLQARLMSQALRKLTASAARTKTTIVFINQLRTKVGVTFGNPETTTGGQALKFYSSVRLDIRKIGSNVSDGVATGQKCRIKVVKNKLAAPFRSCEVGLDYRAGFIPVDVFAAAPR